MQQPKLRRTVGIVILVVFALFAASLVAMGQSTAKNLSSNFTLVNLSTSANNVSINYYKPDGTAWRASETAVLATQGSQVIKRQYEDASLTPGNGSVVVGGSGAMGGVVQILARGQTPTSGAYSGASQGAQTFNVPLVAKNGSSASGTANSQIVVQNTGSTTTFTIDLIDSSGTVVRTTPAQSLNSGAAATYDLNTDSALGNGFYSAVVKAASGGQVAVVVNLFFGANTLQTYSGFAAGAVKWLAPLVTARLGNGLSSPIAVQNLSGGVMAAGEIKLSCIGAGSFPAITLSNTTAVNNTASYFFNPLTDTANWPAGWYGSCTVDTSGKNSVAFVQMRFVGTDNAAAYEAIRADGTKTKSIIPLYAKMLANGFATVTTIQNLSTTQPANVNISYIAGEGQPASCTVTVAKSIPAGGSINQNLRIPSGTDSVAEVPATCVGAIVVTSTNATPIDAVVQLSNILPQAGDTFMAHDGFPAD